VREESMPTRSERSERKCEIKAARALFDHVRAAAAAAAAAAAVEFLLMIPLMPFFLL
jgi:hypothetical protein